MKRTKSPTLTSPWKVGFFVSLMLVFVSIGVTYYFAHRYGLSLGIVDRNWLDRNEWLGVIRGQGVLFEVLPLLGLVAVMSMISYLVIANAVRKYKKYLDSGLDYKHLLTSLKDIEDLEDKSKIERIKNHPELKRVLLGVADALEERERVLAEREGALETRLNDALGAKEKEMADDFASQCDLLARAVQDRTLDPSAIEFSNPNLRRLSDAFQKAGDVSREPRASDLTESYGDLQKTSSLFQSKLREITEELKVSREGAQEIEQQLRGLVQSAWKGAGAAGHAGADDNTIQSILASFKSLEDLGASIEVLSEEAKGVAISTALHAGSGMGTQDDLIRLADDVKEVAARFKEAAKRFTQISGEIRIAAGGLEPQTEKAARQAAGGASGERNLATALSRVTLWVERIVVLSDKLTNLRESYELAMGTLPGSPEEPIVEGPSGESVPGVTPSTASELSEDFEFESLERRRTIFSDGESREEAAPPQETTAEEMMAEEAPVEGPPSDEMPAETERRRERDRTTFEELAARSFSPTEDVEIVDEEPAERDSGDGGMTVLRPGVFSRRGPERPEHPVDEPAPSEELDSDVVEEIELSPSAVAARERRMKSSLAPEGRDDDQDEETVDLYALGAVDYDPAMHG